MDACRRPAPAVARLETGERIPDRPLGPLLRADDPLRARDRLTDACHSVRGVASLAAAGHHIRRAVLHRRARSALRAPVLSCVGRLSRVARTGVAADRLVAELTDRDSGAQGL